MDSSDQTIIKPRPGRPAKAKSTSPVVSDETIITPRKRPQIPNPESEGSPSGLDSTVFAPRKPANNRPVVALNSTPELTWFSSSSVVTAASTILSLPSQLRQITSNVDVNQLHMHIKRQLHNFDAELLKICDDPQIRNDSSYILCALIDETVLNTGWGENSSWAQNPMLSIFHQETYGGEKFYEILDVAQQTPSRYEDLLELSYLALSLGFMGKYRVDPKGPIKIEQTRSQVYDLLTRSRDDLELTLSPDCKPLSGYATRLHSFLPYWIVSALLVLIAFGIYSYWLVDLNKQSDSASRLLASLVPLTAQAELAEEKIPIEVKALELLLADEIKRDLLNVEHFSRFSAITLKDDQIFSSGSASISEGFLPILDKLGKALETIPGQVIITGHTDNQAIRTPKFPSNWHLSLARASSVVKYLDQVAALNGRLLPQGRGAEHPVADNTTAEGRAKNRRVVVGIYYLRTPGAQVRGDR